MLVYTYIGCIFALLHFPQISHKGCSRLFKPLHHHAAATLAKQHNFSEPLLQSGEKKIKENGFSETYSPCFQISSLETLGNQNPVYEEVSEVDLPQHLLDSLVAGVSHKSFFIVPMSDHSLPMSVTNSLTD